MSGSTNNSIALIALELINIKINISNCVILTNRLVQTFFIGRKEQKFILFGAVHKLRNALEMGEWSADGSQLHTYSVIVG